MNQISHPISKRCSWWDESNLLPVENPEVEGEQFTNLIIANFLVYFIPCMYTF